MSENKSDFVKKQKRDPDLISAEIAMKRAARRARELAKNTGTAIIILKNNIIQEERTT